MARELKPGVFTAIFARYVAAAEAVSPAALTGIGLGIEREAKDRLSRLSHPHGTPTPAQRGGPPAQVSGTLRRSVTHSRVERTDHGWEMRVGVARGLYPPYPKRGRKTQSSEYALYLERHLDYPFLEPAFRAVVGRLSAAQLGRLWSAGWR